MLLIITSYREATVILKPHAEFLDVITASVKKLQTAHVINILYSVCRVLPMLDFIPTTCMFYITDT